jgi:hypothetical protein
MIKPQDKTVQVDKLTSHMVGKTIKRIDETACNCLNFEFTDGTELLLEVEAVGHGLYGNIGYIKD